MATELSVQSVFRRLAESSEPVKFSKRETVRGVRRSLLRRYRLSFGNVESFLSPGVIVGISTIKAGKN
jgi:hypothetical protein